MFQPMLVVLLALTSFTPSVGVGVSLGLLPPEEENGKNKLLVSVFPVFNSRKLFEPKYFPNAGVLKFFDKYFGKFNDRNHSEVRTLCW